MSLLDLLMNGPSASDRFQQVQGLMQLSPGGPRQGSLGPMPGGLGGSGEWEQQARRYFLQHGYSPADFRKVDYIIENESGWDPSAVNKSSGAAGIAQRISGYGPGYQQNNPMQQIRWLMNYLNTHNYSGYGTGINAAYAHKRDTGWY